MNSLLLVGLLAILSLALATERVTVESSFSLPDDWERKEVIAADTPLKLIFAVKQNNVDELERILLAVSDPRSPDYGKHLKKAQVEALVAPSAQSKNIVLNYLSENGVKAEEIEDKNDFIVAVVSAKKANDLLGCTFYNFVHQTSQKSLARCDKQYTVPAKVASQLDFIGGVNRFPKIFSKKITRMEENVENIKDIEPGFGVTPRIIRDRYNIGDTEGQVDTNKQAVAQFLDQFYDEVDLEIFFTLFYWPAIGNTVDRVVGNNTDYEPGTEATLDIQYIMSTGSNVKTWFYSTLGEHQNQEPFLEWTFIVNNETDDEIPGVISISYGDDEDSLSYEYANRVNIEFKKIGVRGVSLLFASGDDGVGCNGNGTLFVPNFPASSPWVTAVGGTAPADLFELGDEVVNSLSGGGFSNFFGQPEYQQEAVQNYLSTAQDLPDSSFYNSSGRAYPDVSALSSGFTIVIYGIVTPGVAGTSCAAPTFSGVVALLNDLRLQNNKPTLGFLNPFIYQNPQAFFDVTEGCNPSECPNDGFCAQAGWDPSSGMGSPLYDALAKAVLELP